VLDNVENRERDANEPSAFVARGRRNFASMEIRRHDLVALKRLPKNGYNLSVLRLNSCNSSVVQYVNQC
jgi:hypothetical protein